MQNLIFNLIMTLMLSFQPALAGPHLNWDLNDVTYLMPLPQTADQENLIDWSESLLPTQILQELPRLTPGAELGTVTRTIKVFGVRVDPCFQANPMAPCQAQVRFVWQPLVIGVQGRATTQDAAYHSFYNLTDSQFQNLLQALQAWKSRFVTNATRTNGLALQVHPILASSPQALTEFNRLILSHLQSAKLSRATAMVLRGGGNMWAFTGLDLSTAQDGSTLLIPIRIPRLTQAAQTFVNQAVPFDSFEESAIVPSPVQVEDNFGDFVKLAKKNHFLTEAELNQALKSAAKFENPRFFNSENLDCMSCHLAQPVRTWTEPEFAKKNPVAPVFAETYTNPRHNLENTTTELLNTGQLRGLGYFGWNAVISQRVIHDSAEVADQLNAR